MVNSKSDQVRTAWLARWRRCIIGRLCIATESSGVHSACLIRPAPSMRDRLWNNLIDLRFKAYYYGEYASFLSNANTAISIFLAVVTSATVAAWLHESTWASACAVVIFITQVVSAARPFLPALRKSHDYTQCSLALEKLFIGMEERWNDCEKQDDESKYESAVTELRERLHRFDCQHSSLPTPDWKFLSNRARRRIDRFMELNHGQQEQ